MVACTTTLTTNILLIHTIIMHYSTKSHINKEEYHLFLAKKKLNNLSRDDYSLEYMFDIVVIFTVMNSKSMYKKSYKL